MYKILIIDDSVYTLDLHAEYVKQAGHEAIIADNGPAAIQIYQQAQPHIVLCDIMMPEMDGFEVCVELKALNPSLFFYFISAEMTTATQKKAKALHADGFLQKPIDINSIASIVQQYESILGVK